MFQLLLSLDIKNVSNDYIILVVIDDPLFINSLNISPFIKFLIFLRILLELVFLNYKNFVSIKFHKPSRH